MGIMDEMTGIPRQTGPAYKTLTDGPRGDKLRGRVIRDSLGPVCLEMVSDRGLNAPGLRPR
jgi:hypothetical protein